MPQIDPEILKLSGYTNSNEYESSWPCLFVFAFDGIKLKTCVTHMREFYAQHPEIPLNRIPRLLIVNGKYAISHIHCRNPKILNPHPLNDNTKGTPLFWMANEIAKGLSWLNGMYLNYNKYYEIAYQQNI